MTRGRRPKAVGRSLRVWDASADAYDRFEMKWHYYSRVGEKLVGALPLRPDSTVLELACGTGACTTLLVERVLRGRITAVDQSSEMLEAARRNSTHVGRRLTFREGGVGQVLRALAKRQRMFDFVVCNSAFWQFPEVESLPREIHGVMKRGGFLGFNLPFWFHSRREHLQYRRTVDGVLMRNGIEPREFWSKRLPVDYPKLLTDSGFVVVKDARYHVTMRKQESLEWRRIPAFRRRWGTFQGLPRSVASDVRKELEARRRRRPEDRALVSNWRLILAEAR